MRTETMAGHRAVASLGALHGSASPAISPQLPIAFGAPRSDETTSAAAARQIEPHLERLQQRVLDAILRAGVSGLTDAEGQVATGLEGSTYRPRRRWLEQHHYVADSGMTRPTPSGRAAAVWVANIFATGR